MGSGKRSSKGLKICIGVTALLLITLLVVLVILFLTVLKPKGPKITTQSVTLDNWELVVFPLFSLKVSLGVVVAIDNRNYGSFKYKPCTAYVSYRGAAVAEAAIEGGIIPSHGKHNISTNVNISADKLMTDPNFSGDFALGILNFTSSTILHGKVSMLKFFEMKAAGYSTCDFSIFVKSKSVVSVCKSKVKL